MKENFAPNIPGSTSPKEMLFLVFPVLISPVAAPRPSKNYIYIQLVQ